MEKAQVAVLKAEIQSQLSEIEKAYQRIEERKDAKTRIELESLSFWLHNLYCAFEDLFEIVARFFENNVTRREHYLIELLKRMTLSIPGVRPPLFSDKTYLLLDKLRAFRHVIRHAYVYDLDERQVKLVLEDVLKLKSPYSQEVNHFLSNF